MAKTYWWAPTLFAAACGTSPLKVASNDPNEVVAGDSAGTTPDDSRPPVDSVPETGDPATDSADPAPDLAGDEDGDGLTNAEEGAEEGIDTDRDGTPDYLDLDSDNDGISDADELGPRTPDGAPADTDGDTTPDFRDGDSDGDSILDRDEAFGLSGEASPDTDGDGIPDARDTDADADGMLDAEEGTADWDGDGIPNWRDPRNDIGAVTVTFVAISTDFNSPIGIDFHAPTRSVALSVNYPSGNPNTLELVAADGTHSTFGPLAGLTDEVKIATVRPGNVGGFTSGELFVGNGVDGQITRVSADGSTVINPWVDLPGTNNGLMRGSLYIDRTGVWGGDLLVATTQGELWRITSTGVPTLVADVGSVHLEGLITVPDAPARFGPLAGLAIAGAEGEGVIYAFAPDGSYARYNVGVNVEDIDVIVPDENFFGVNFGTSRLVGIEKTELRPLAGDILLTQEGHTGTGLFRLYWDGASLVATELLAAPASTSISQWEHVTLADASIKEI